jgi:tripartite-type tricarboxylate transporter receptor subunit TctC
MQHASRFTSSARLATRIATALAVIAGTGTVFAQDGYPNKPITVIVPYAPGGQGDVFARLVGEQMTRRMGQAVIVDNRPGATGALGTRLAAKARGDGYTLLLGQTGEMAINQSVVKNLGYDPLKDFKPIVLVGDAPLVLSAPASGSFKTLPALIAGAKAKPGSVSYASSGTATPGHLAAAALALGTRTEMIHVPYKGAGQAMSDLLGAQVQFFFPSASAVMPHVKSGKLLALAVSTPKRMAALPDVPTVAESVLPGFAYSLWGGLFAPSETPDAIVQRLNKEVNEILAEPALHARFEADASAVAKNTPAEFAEFVRKDAGKYAQLIKATGIHAE